MYRCSPQVLSAIPPEFRESAEQLFPRPTVEAAAAFAGVLGIADYTRLLAAGTSDTGTDRFLGHFRNNLDLLIQKTWVEKADEARKEKLQNRIPGFIADIARGDYQRALTEFSGILEELRYLLFGVQSRQDDFAAYAFRIDMQMGLFWWYGGQIACLAGETDTESLRAVLLIGICYLTNF
jgi:hypothetical protein